MKTSPDRSGFTLIEMLVVIAIVALLASLMAGAVTKSRNKATQVSSLSNLRQIYLGFLAYGLENNETWPAPKARWSNAIWPYIYGEGESTPADDEQLFDTVFVSPGWNTPEMRKAYPNMADEIWRQSYGMNVLLPDDLDRGARFSSGADRPKLSFLVKAPSRTMLLQDSVNALALPHFNNLAAYGLAASRYDGNLSALFCDGHVEMLALRDERFVNTAAGDEAKRHFWFGDDE